MSKPTWQAAALICLLGLLARPARSQHTVNLEGRIRTDRGEILPSGVTVRLETGQGMLVGEQPANSDGVYKFLNLQKTPYRLTATADGYQPTQKDFDLSQSGGIAIIDLILTPANRTKEASSGLPKVLDANVPKKARKEYEKGSHALAERKLPEAQTHLENAVQEYPCYARAQADLALIFSEQRDSTRAEAALNKAIECAPDFLDAYTQLGQLLNAEKKFAESEKVLSEGMRRSPNAWLIQYQLAAAHLGLGQFDKAEADYLKAQSLNANPPPDIHVKLADVYLKSNNYNKAYAEMQEYLRLEPEGRFAKKIAGIMHDMESSGVLRAATHASAPPSQPSKQ